MLSQYDSDDDDCRLVTFGPAPMTRLQGAACPFRHNALARETSEVCSLWLIGQCRNATCGLRHFKACVTPLAPQHSLTPYLGCQRARGCRLLLGVPANRVCAVQWPRAFASHVRSCMKENCPYRHSRPRPVQLAEPVRTHPCSSQPVDDGIHEGGRCRGVHCASRRRRTHHQR